MREILFKAKRLDNGEWIEGLFWRHSIYGVERLVMGSTRASSLDYFEINAETVCQFTGITDVYGMKIFEGDKIVTSHLQGGWARRCSGVVQYGGMGFSYVGTQEDGSEWICSATETIENGLASRVVVTGNIHDK